jgi:hypothetical protein
MQMEMPAAGRHGEAGVHQLVGEHHGVLQAALAEGRVDELGDFLLLQHLVDVGEIQARGRISDRKARPVTVS